MESNARPLIPWAYQWRQVRAFSNIQGWADREEAIIALCRLLGVRVRRVFEILNEVNSNLSVKPYQIKERKSKRELS
jgi:hypothetical protein